MITTPNNQDDTSLVPTEVQDSQSNNKPGKLLNTSLNALIIVMHSDTIILILSDNMLVIIIATIGVVVSFSLVLNVLLVIALIKKSCKKKSPGKLINLCSFVCSFPYHVHVYALANLNLFK